MNSNTDPDAILTIEKLVEPSVKVSPEEPSRPKMAQISPGPMDSILHLITVHPNETGNLDFLAGASAKDLVALLQSSLVDPHVGHLPSSSLKASPTRGASAAEVS
jgi:hypothetical protein